MVVRLKELYNTRYLYKTFTEDMRLMFRTVVDLRNDSNTSYHVGNDLQGKVYESAKAAAPLQFDLADVKLSSDVTPIIQEYARAGIEFIDTQDAKRNEILRTNRERYAVDTSGYVTLPEYNPSQLVSDYIKLLSKDVVYKMPVGKNEIYLPLTFLILVCRPSIRIDLGTVDKAFFRFVYDHIPRDVLDNYTEFYFTTQEGTEIVNFNSGKIVTQRLGEVDFDTALTLGTLVPSVLGQKQLNSDDNWDVPVTLCLNYLTSYRSTQKVTLRELLSGEN